MLKNIRRILSKALWIPIFWVFYLFVRLLTVYFRITSNPAKNANRDSILFLAAYFDENAGYEYRVKKWAEMLRADGVKVTVKTVFKRKEFDRALSGNSLWLYVKPLALKTFQVLGSGKYGKVIVRRELLIYNDYGNLFLEKLLLTIHPEAILDFDDDIAAAKNEPRTVSNLYNRVLLMNGAKFTASLKLYRNFIAGSDYLKEKILELNNGTDPGNGVVLPTCVDYEKFENKQYRQADDPITFGWIGNNKNLPLIRSLIPSLNEISKTYPIRLLLICGSPVEIDAEFEIIFKNWGMESQIDDLKQIDIGLMPLQNNAISRGKCGFKLIQYMGLGMVGIASAVTVNHSIISDGEDGFLVDTDKNNWVEVIQKVIDLKADWQAIGTKAAEKIKRNYSFEANYSNFKNYLGIKP